MSPQPASASFPDRSSGRYGPLAYGPSPSEALAGLGAILAIWSFNPLLRSH
jgi:hypothetical protein